MDRKRRSNRMHLVRLRFLGWLLHKPLEPMLLGLNFGQPPANLGTPMFRSPHFQHEPLFFHFKHGQLEEGAGRSSGTATIHQSSHRFNMLHATLLKCHGFPLSLPLAQDSDRGWGPTTTLLFADPQQAERARAGSALR